MPSNVTSWRANMKIGTGPPGHYESEIVSSNWCYTREKAEAEAKKYMKMNIPVIKNAIAVPILRKGVKENSKKKISQRKKCL